MLGNISATEDRRSRYLSIHCTRFMVQLMTQTREVAVVEEAQKRPRGGQTKPPLLRKRNNLTFRARDQLKQDLEAVAAKNARSLSEEIEARLEQSFVDDKALGGPEMARALRSFGP